MKRISHIVNLGIFPDTSDLHYAQPITIETMRIAKDFAAGVVDVKLISAQYTEDRKIVPAHFIATRDLDRSVFDVGNFKVKRKLPLVKDILDRAYEALESDYIIFTNVDIALMPNFYVSVTRLIDSGIDSFVVNKRIISKTHTSVEDIPLMFAEVGRPHMGYDCFIFKRDAYKNYVLGLSCVGAPHFDKILFANGLLNSTKFKVYRDHHITFHIGNDKSWTSKTFQDYAVYNKLEFTKFVETLNPEQADLVQKALADNRSQGLRKKFADYLGARW